MSSMHGDRQALLWYSRKGRDMDLETLGEPRGGGAIPALHLGNPRIFSFLIHAMGAEEQQLRRIV